MNSAVFVGGILAFASIGAIVVLAVAAGCLMVVCENIASTRRNSNH